MGRPRVVDLGEGRRLVDLGFQDTEGLVAAYLLPEPDGWALVETGPTSCRERLLAGVAAAGVEPREVRDILVTHIHLDHAGGLGAVAADFPNARLLAHALGVEHLAEPTRLVASARRAWGEASDRLWGPVVPAPASRLVPLQGGETVPLQGGELQVVPTPGHARHHLSFFDTRLRAVFTGDSAGVRLERSERLRPAVPPPDLDLPSLFTSLERMGELDPRLLCFSHFGVAPDGPRLLREYRTVVERWREVALAAARERPDAAFIARRLQELDEGRTPEGPADPAAQISGYSLAAQGLLRYFTTHGELGGKPG